MNTRSIKGLLGGALNALAFAASTILTVNTAAAETPPPKMPFRPEQYPGANFQSLVCARGPDQSPSHEVDAYVLDFIDDVQHGESRPRHMYRYFPFDLLPLSTHFLVEVGQIKALEFQEAYVACADMLGRATISPKYRPSIIYRYRVVGSRAITGLLIVIRDGTITEFHQEPA